MPLHQQVRGDDSLTHNHRLRPQYGAGGFPNQGALAVKHKECRKTHSQDNPSDIHGIRFSVSLHRKACCGPQEAIPGLMALSAPILLEIQEHCQYLHDRDHEPVNTNSYNSSVLVG